MSKILIIDDNELLSRMLKEALIERGYEVDVAFDANQGYSKAIDFHPDLFLLDVQLPDVIGSDLIRIIKNREDLQHIPIIMITGTHRQTEQKVKAFQAGADDYILKPFEMPELLERVAAVLRRSQASAAQRQLAQPTLSAQTRSSVSPLQPKESAAASIQELSMSQAMKALLLSPFSFPSKVKYPQVAMAYLIALLSVTFLGLAVSAGVPVKPVIVGCAIIGTWGTLMAVLVMSASVAGIPLSWTEGSRFISLAGMPLLFKMIGALVMSAWTTLSPFYYTSSPALFLKSSPTWVERLDLFEIWTVFLVWILISRRPSSNPKKSILVTAVVWVAAMALSVALQKLGGGA